MRAELVESVAFFILPRFQPVAVALDGLAGSSWLLSSAYIIQQSWICFRLLVHWVRWAFSLAPDKAGSSIAARMAMMAMTTSSSMSVNPVRGPADGGNSAAEA